MSLSGNVTALIVRDVFTGWLDGYPAGSKCTEEVIHALQHFVSPTEKAGMVATDDALEYESACKQLGYRHRTSTPGRPQTNGIAERSVREALEGARTVMQQAGSPHRWWARALRQTVSCTTSPSPRTGGFHHTNFDSVWPLTDQCSHLAPKFPTSQRLATQMDQGTSSDQAASKEYWWATS